MTQAAESVAAQWARFGSFLLDDLVWMRCPTCNFVVGNHNLDELNGCIHAAQSDGDPRG